MGNENLQRDFKGVWIPREIWLSKDLSLQEKCLLVEIDSLDNEMGCFASNTYLSEFMGLSPSRISEIVSALINKGYVYQLSEKELTSRGWVTNRVLKVSENRRTPSENRIPPSGSRSTPSENRSTPSECRKTPSENAQYSNTTINTSINTLSNTYSIGKFNKPTTEDIRNYMIKLSVSLSIAESESEKFYDYYESNGWRVGKNPMKNWQAAVRNWKKNMKHSVARELSSEERAKEIVMRRRSIQ